MKCAIQAVFIAKENILFLEEWIDYHMLIGFDTFYLYDNSKVQKNIGFDSKKKHLIPQKVNKWGIDYDKIVNLTNNEIQKIIKQIEVKYKNKVFFIEWSPKDKDGKIIYGQVEALNDCLVNLKKTPIEWCANIDIDEFIVTKNLHEYIQSQGDILCVKMQQLLFDSRFNNLNKLITTINKTAEEILPKNHSNKYIYNVKNATHLDVHDVEGKGAKIYPSIDEIHFNHYKRDFKNKFSIKDHKLVKTDFKYKIVKRPIDPKIVAILKKKSKNYFIKKIKNQLTRKNKKLNRNKTLKSKDQ
jgi:hypothetical protein